MSAEEIEALQQLQNQKDIVINQLTKVEKLFFGLLTNMSEMHRVLKQKILLQIEDHTISTAYEISTFATHLNKNYHINVDLLGFLQAHSPPRSPIFLQATKKTQAYSLFQKFCHLDYKTL